MHIECKNIALFRVYVLLLNNNKYRRHDLHLFEQYHKEDTKIDALKHSILIFYDSIFLQNNISK